MKTRIGLSNMSTSVKLQHWMNSENQALNDYSGKSYHKPIYKNIWFIPNVFAFQDHFVHAKYGTNQLWSNSCLISFRYNRISDWLLTKPFQPKYWTKKDRKFFGL